MVAYFSGTIDALKKGVTKMSVAAAIKNIENWEESLRDIELTGCRSILRDLAALKKQLQEDQPDGDRIRHLMAKLASETVTISQKADARHGDKIAKLGEMLGHAAEGTESGANHQTRSDTSTATSGRGNEAHDADGRFAKGNHSGGANTSSPKSGNHGTDDNNHPRDEEGRYVKSDTHRSALTDGDGRHDRSR
jgi:hypothetical protein